VTTDVFKDLRDFHDRMNFTQAFEAMNEVDRVRFLNFRIAFLKEELGELQLAYETGDNPEIVDALVDLAVVALGTLDAMGVDGARAWREVMRANNQKLPGIKRGRPNPLKLPDLVKPDGWKAPDHSSNTGRLP
jgi:predicted HAD superfamily Cof-like phosphohydrolase